MLDVHPPHAATHSWKDFFIHVGTICVGLLIAVGIEQSVEWMHRRHERQELREALQKEHEENARIYLTNVAWYRYDRELILNDLRVIEYLEQHPGTPEEKLPGVLRWRATYKLVVTTAYVNAQQTQTIGLLPQKEAESLTAFYDSLKLAQDYASASALKIQNAADFAAIDPNPSHLSAAKLQRQEEFLLNSFTENYEWAIWLFVLQKQSPDLPAGITGEEMFQSAGWVRSAEDEARLAGAIAITQKELTPFGSAALAAQQRKDAEDAAEASAHQPNH